MQHKGTMRLETDRLILRKFIASDADAAFRNWTSDEQVTEFLRWPTHKDIRITEQVLNDWIAGYEKTEKLHIGYCIGSKWWHFGYTSEAFSAIIPFFFEQVKAKRIESQHDPKNPNSGKVMTKCGLIYEGTLRKADWSNKGIVDACMYGMLASDYFKE
ncbi:MAG: GNAT family N-acetyltransferase [Lachnospiraceae bacterium]